MTGASAGAPSQPLTGASLRLLVAATFLLVAGVRLGLVARFGSNLPFWDQWDAEAAGLYVPYLEGHLDPASLLGSHNEHRILFTRLLGLGLLELAGAWVPRIEMAMNALLYAGFMAGLAALLMRIVPARFAPLVVAAVIVTGIVPVGWENLFAGFQSQFFFLLAFSLVALLMLGRAVAFSGSWVVALGAALAAYFSMASGALTVFAGLGLVLWQMIGRVRPITPREIAGVVTLGAAGIVMLFWIEHIPGHDALKAHGAVDFVGAFLRIASYPVAGLGLVVLYGPILWFAFDLLRRRCPLADPAWAVLGLAAWVPLQGLSMAYGRAATVLASRYLDLMIVAWPVSLAVLVHLLARTAGRARIATAAALGLWIALMGVGLVVRSIPESWAGLDERVASVRMQEINVAAYLETGNPAALPAEPFLAIPYPDPTRLAVLLSDPTVRAILADDIRPTDADVAAVRSTMLLGGALAAPVQWVFASLLAGGWLFAVLGLVAFAPGAYGALRHGGRNGRG